MRAWTRALGLGLTFAALALAQGHEAEASDPWLGWKWANFAILAIGLGYLIRKSAPAFFKQRSEEIQKGIADAAREKKDAEVRAAAIELRLKGLDKEIEALRTNARAEIAADTVCYWAVKSSVRPGALPLHPAGAVGPRPQFYLFRE